MIPKAGDRFRYRGQGNAPLIATLVQADPKQDRFMLDFGEGNIPKSRYRIVTRNFLGKKV